MTWTNETVTIDGQSLTIDGAYELVDTTPLYQQGPARGQDVVIAGLDGRLARKRARDGLRITLMMYVKGEVDAATSNPATDKQTTLQDNLLLLNDLLPPYTGGARQVTISHTTHDGTVRTASCVVERVTFSQYAGLRSPIRRAALDIWIADGELT